MDLGAQRNIQTDQPPRHDLNLAALVSGTKIAYTIIWQNMSPERKNGATMNGLLPSTNSETSTSRGAHMPTWRCSAW